MGEHSLFEDGAARGDEGDVTTAGALVAHVERYEDAPDECTIYPDGVAAADLVTRWVTAEEGVYVGLAEMR